MNEKKLYKGLLILIVIFLMYSILRYFGQMIIYKGEYISVSKAMLYLIWAYIEFIWINKLKNKNIRELLGGVHFLITFVIFVFMASILHSVLSLAISHIAKILIILFTIQTIMSFICLLVSIKNNDKNFNGIKYLVIAIDILIGIVIIIRILIDPNVSFLNWNFLDGEMLIMAPMALVSTIGVIVYDKYLKIK